MQMKRKCAAKQNKTVNHFALLLINCKSEYSANRPYDRNTFDIQKSHEEENKLPPNSLRDSRDWSTGLTSIPYVTFYIC